VRYEELISTSDEELFLIPAHSLVIVDRKAGSEAEFPEAFVTEREPKVTVFNRNESFTVFSTKV